MAIDIYIVHSADHGRGSFRVAVKVIIGLDDGNKIYELLNETMAPDMDKGICDLILAHPYGTTISIAFLPELV